jgi:transglutaminase-like putative cysteine protease
MTRFDLSIALDYDVVTQSDFVLLIQPANTACQRVTWERLRTEPVLATREELHGSPATRYLRLSAAPGKLHIRYDAIVDVVHHFALPSDIEEVPVARLPARVLPYVYPSRYCQSDRMMSFAREHFGDLTPGYGRVEAIRAWVQQHVSFTPGSSHAGTSALETFECRNGVCRD